MLPNQTISAILSSLRTFEPLSDTLDIIIISFVFYQLLQFARKSRAGQLVKGILLIIVSYGLAVMLNLKTPYKPPLFTQSAPPRGRRCRGPRR